jgi:hypothetical protein
MFASYYLVYKQRKYIKCPNNFHITSPITTKKEDPPPPLKTTASGLACNGSGGNKGAMLGASVNKSNEIDIRLFS